MFKKLIRFSPGVALPMVLNFLLTILYASYLEPSEYGVLNLYLNTIQILYAVTLSVFQNASLRCYSLKESYKGEKEFHSTYVYSNIATTLLLLPVSYIVNRFLHFDWLIVVLSVGCNGLFQYMCNYHRLNNSPKKYNSIRMMSSLGAVVILVVLSRLIHPLSYIWPIVSVYGMYGIVAIAELLKIRNELHIKDISRNLLKESFRYGVPLIGVSLSSYVISSCGQYFLQYYLGEEAVGNYALGNRLVDAIIVNLLMMILLVMTPELNKKHDVEGENSSRQALSKMTSAAMWIMLPITVAIIVYADSIITFVFPKYNDAAHIMRLVVFASLFHGLSMFTCKGLELSQKTKYIFYSMVIAAVTNIGYNALGIPIYGIDASAHASLIAYGIYNILLVFFSRKCFRLLFDFRYFAKVIMVTICTVVFAIGLQKVYPINSMVSFLLQGGLSIVVYMTLSFVTKLFAPLK